MVQKKMPYNPEPMPVRIASKTTRRPRFSLATPAVEADTKSHFKELYNKYANLFDLAPNAYLVVDESGLINEANLTAAIMLNEPRSELIGQPIAGFIHLDDQDVFQRLKQDCLKSGEPHIAEIKMVQAGGRRFPAQVQLQSLPCSHQSGSEFRAAIMDLSESARISANLNLLHQCLEIAVRATDAQQLLEDYVRQIKIFARCSAVGIRLRDEAGFIPYQAYDGFSLQFFESENQLSLHSDQCLCIVVIQGQCDPGKDYFTPYGSLYINGTSRFLAAVPPEERGRTRNVCNAVGYESVALIPITIDQTISGLIHVADYRENMFPLRMVQVLEQAAMRLGLALQRLHMQSRLAETVTNLRELSSHLMKAKEEEQRRIAMELHDQTGQDLNVLKLRLSQFRDNLRKDQSVLKQSCAGMLSFTDRIIDTVRRITRDLNPAILESLGLRAAVQQMVREFRDYAGICIQTDIEALDRVENLETRINLFRIIQEALTNINKHAQATVVVIEATADGDERGLRVLVEDNGKGFVFKGEQASGGRGNGMGLAAMHLRSRIIGAGLKICSQPGKGTAITISLPWRP